MIVGLNDLFETNYKMMGGDDSAISYFQMSEYSSKSSTSEDESNRKGTCNILRTRQIEMILIFEA